MTNTTTTQHSAGSLAYRLAPAPRGAGVRSWSCSFCDADLTRPVFLTGPTGLVAAGSGCASLALYGTKARASRVRSDAEILAARAARDRRSHLELAAARRPFYAGALADFLASRDAGSFDYSDRLLAAVRTYADLGGCKMLGVALPVFLARVALSGVLPD